VCRALYAAAELKLADFLAAEPMTNGELAPEAGVNPPTMRRLMRALVAHGVFEELSVDCFALNAAGELLRRDVSGSQRAGVLFTAGAMRWELWSDFLECVRTGNAAIERAVGKTIFERHAENAEEAALFREAVAGFAAALSAPLMAAYDFGRFNLVADIGGGNGRLIADILARHPSARRHPIRPAPCRRRRAGASRGGWGRVALRDCPRKLFRRRAGPRERLRPASDLA
jgi:hypothetical protein